MLLTKYYLEVEKMKIQELKQLNIKMEFLDCKRNYVTIFEGRFIDLFSLDYFSLKFTKPLKELESIGEDLGENIQVEEVQELLNLKLTSLDDDILYCMETDSDHSGYLNISMIKDKEDFMYNFNELLRGFGETATSRSIEPNYKI